MRFTIAWHTPALVMMYRLPTHSAMIVDRAVIDFVESGTGHLEWDPHTTASASASMICSSPSTARDRRSRCSASTVCAEVGA